MLHAVEFCSRIPVPHNYCNTRKKIKIQIRSESSQSEVWVPSSLLWDTQYWTQIMS